MVVGIEGVFNPSVCGLLMLPVYPFCCPRGNIRLSNLDPKAKVVRSVFVMDPELWSCHSLCCLWFTAPQRGANLIGAPGQSSAGYKAPPDPVFWGFFLLPV